MREQVMGTSFVDLNQVRHLEWRPGMVFLIVSANRIIVYEGVYRRILQRICRQE